MATPVARKPRKPTGRGIHPEVNHPPPTPDVDAARSSAPTTPDTPPPPPAEVTGSAVAESVSADLRAPMPPMLDESGAPRTDVIGAGWFYNRMITYLWSYDSPIGVWVWVDGVGWKRLSPVSQFGHTHMTVLATLATHRNLPVSYHEDASGQIDQIMV